MMINNSRFIQLITFFSRYYFMEKHLGMKFFVAIDSFKNCLTSKEANEAARLGIMKSKPKAEVNCYEVSDGGEGFLEAYKPDEIVSCHVHDAMMRWCDSAFGIKDGKAIIEVAKAVGLGMIEPENRNPLVATSYGVGELMVQAMRRGCRDFVIGLGGSATSDCGLGMLKALRHEWQVTKHKAWYEPFDTSWLKDINVTLATDVDNPLCGPEGAAHIFAPQKGADGAMVEKLERRAMTFAKMSAEHQGRDCSSMPGAGAAGGLGYAFMEFMNAKVESGAETILRSVRFDDRLTSQEVEMVVTGEGSADEQTLMGKLPSVILSHCRAHGVPVILVAGKIGHEKSLLAAGFSKVININDGLEIEHALDKDVAMERLANSVSGAVSSI